MTLSKEAQSRAKAAVIGSLVADAAGQPFHWVYDLPKVEELLRNGNAEFREDWHCPYYQIPVGTQSGYGDQIVVGVNSLVGSQGFDMKDYVRATVEMFGPNSSYREPNPTSKDQYPKKGPWIHGTISKSMDKLIAGVERGGVDMPDSDGYVKMIPIVARYAGSSDLMDIVDGVVRLTVNNDQAVRAAQAGARLLEQYILHGRGDATIANWIASLDAVTRAEMEVVVASKDIAPLDASRKFGAACYVPGNFQVAIHCLLNNTDFVDGVRAGISYGGANCSRLCFIGACLGAQCGVESIPKEWLRKTLCSDRVLQLLDRFFSD